jgi:hypothetical protein
MKMDTGPFNGKRGWRFGFVALLENWNEAYSETGAAE